MLVTLFMKLIYSQFLNKIIISNCIKIEWLFVIVNLLSSRIFIITRCFRVKFLSTFSKMIRHTTKTRKSKKMNFVDYFILFSRCNLSNFWSIINRFRSFNEYIFWIILKTLIKFQSLLKKIVIYFVWDKLTILSIFFHKIKNSSINFWNLIIFSNFL